VEIDALAAEVAQTEKELAELEQQLTEARTEEINLRRREEAATRILSMQDIDPEEELARAQRKLLVVFHRITEAKEVWIGHVDLLHLIGRWEATKISPERVVFVYDRRIILNMPCSNFKPILSSCTLSNQPVYVKGKPHVDYCPIPEFTAYIMDCARRALVAGRFGSTTKKIVKSLTNFWTACAEIREEILMLQCKYAVGFHSEGNALRMEVPLLFMKTMAKVLLDFTFDEKCIRQWPLTLPAIRFEARLGYTLDGKDIRWVSLSIQRTPITNLSTVWKMFIELRVIGLHRLP
jgi:kinetochore protein Spc7/SPC105